MDDVAPLVLVAADVEAEFLRSRGMLGASLRHRGVEMLRRIEDLDVAAATGSTGEPMTGPPNTLVSGRGLVLVAPGGQYRAAFRISIEGGHE